MWRGVRVRLRGAKFLFSYERLYAPVRGAERSYARLMFSFACQKRTRNPSRAGSAGDVFLSVKWLALRAGQRQGGVFRLPPPYLWTPLSPQRVKGCSPLTNLKKKSKPKNASRCAKRIFLCFSHLRLRRRFHVSAGRYRQQRGNTSCEAASRRNEKKAFSEAASFFPFRQLLRDYQGRVALDSCLPRLESSGCFSGSLLARKREH